LCEPAGHVDFGFFRAISFITTAAQPNSRFDAMAAPSRSDLSFA
jgi:hypothetical protein